MKLTRNFYLDEFVPKLIWGKFGDHSLWFLDPRLPALCQAIRDHFGEAITINDWSNGGKLEQCGFRPPETTTGAALSQHRFGRASDLHFATKTPEEVRTELRKNFSKFHALGLTTIEKDTPTWVHIDMRWTQSIILLEVPYQ